MRRGEGEREKKREGPSSTAGPCHHPAAPGSMDLNASFLLIVSVSIRDLVYLYIHY